MFKEANYYPLHALLAFNYKSKANTPPKFQRTKLELKTSLNQASNQYKSAISSSKEIKR